MGLYVRSYHLISYSSSPARVPLQKPGDLGRGLIRTILSSHFLFLFTCPSTPAKTEALGRGLIRTILSYPILFLFTPAKTGALGRGLVRTILSYPILFCFTRPSTPAKTGALGRGPMRTILSYPILFLFTCPNTPAKTGASGRGLILIRTILSYPFLRSYSSLPARVPLENWGSRQGAYTYDPIISYPILFTCPSPLQKLGI